jgi:antitoxin component YwqK of YwqJK toxin-antitoxin module
MTKFVVIFGLGVVSTLTACSEKTAVDNPDEHLVVTDTCRCDELNRQELYLKDGTPYNGICTEYFPGTTQPFMTTAITKGKPVRHFYYDRSGKLTHEEKSSGQVKQLERLTCLCTDLEEQKESTIGGTKKVYYLNGKKFNGVCEVYYPDSTTIAAKRNYHQGLIHGRSTTFDKNGQPILHQEYNKGEYLKDIVP